MPDIEPGAQSQFFEVIQELIGIRNLRALQ
jgi:hypothetical protein